MGLNNILYQNVAFINENNTAAIFQCIATQIFRYFMRRNLNMFLRLSSI